jgi:hypothetical protein
LDVHINKNSSPCFRAKNSRKVHKTAKPKLFVLTFRVVEKRRWCFGTLTVEIKLKNFIVRHFYRMFQDMQKSSAAYSTLNVKITATKTNYGRKKHDIRANYLLIGLCLRPEVDKY